MQLKTDPCYVIVNLGTPTLERSRTILQASLWPRKRALFDVPMKLSDEVIHRLLRCVMQVATKRFILGEVKNSKIENVADASLLRQTFQLPPIDLDSLHLLRLLAVPQSDDDRAHVLGAIRRIEENGEAEEMVPENSNG